jgi:hypothetical protein
MIPIIVASIPVTAVLAWSAWAARKGKISRRFAITLSALVSGVAGTIAAWTIDGNIGMAIGVGFFAAVGVSLGVAANL